MICLYNCTLIVNVHVPNIKNHTKLTCTCTQQYVTVLTHKQCSDLIVNMLMYVHWTDLRASSRHIVYRV